jgi:LPXTG-motif cell wall-anchored protein
VLQRMALLVAAAALLVVMTASFAWAQPGGTTNPCPSGQFEIIDPEDQYTLICVPAKDAKGKDSEPLPKTGGITGSAGLLTAAALVLGSGLIGYGILRRR